MIDVTRMIGYCWVQMLYETASSCLVGKVGKSGRRYKNVTCQCRKTTLRPMCSAEFPDLLFYKYQQALVHPGEAVGMLAAQVYVLAWLCEHFNGNRILYRINSTQKARQF